MLQSAGDNVFDRVENLVPGIAQASTVSFQESRRAQRGRNSI
jgi:hypothetical protein